MVDINEVVAIHPPIKIGGLLATKSIKFIDERQIKIQFYIPHFLLLFCIYGGIEMRAIIFGLVVAFLLATTIGASATTTTNITWDGGGVVNVNWNSGDDAEMIFSTIGSEIEGNLIAEDKDDNPYGYGIDTSDVKVSAKVKNGGIIYWFNRTDSYKSMYGEPGQEVYTHIESDDEATFDWHSWSNYARYRSKNYKWKNNNQITAKGDHYIFHSFYVNKNNGASIMINASGKTELTIMNEDHWGNSFKFGKGCGCYTNAKVTIDGSGYFSQIATAEHHLETDTGIEIDGEAFYQVCAKFADGFHFGNFALEGS